MTLPNRPVDDQPIHKAAQRMRWFVQSFQTQIDLISADTGNVFALDLDALAQVFTEWLHTFEAQKPLRQEDKQAYVGFAAGLMLRALLRHKPVRLIEMPREADEKNPAYFWPEGYLYAIFCLKLRGLVLEIDFDTQQHPAEVLGEARTWHSFRENVAEDSSLAIAFLDLFAGEEPEWLLPDVFRRGQKPQLAGSSANLTLTRIKD